MKRIQGYVFLLVWSFLASACYAEERVSLSYLGLKFSVPAGVTAMGVNDDIFILRYGAEQGKRYLGFTQVEASPEYQCSVAELMRTVFGDLKNSSCDEQQRDAFVKVFASEGSHGKWERVAGDVFYSQLKGALYLFVLASDKKVIQIESDYLTKAQIKKVIGL